MESKNDTSDCATDSRSKAPVQPRILKRISNKVGRALALARLPAIFIVVFLAAIWISYQPSTVIDNNWSRFQVFQRGLFWFLRGTAIRTLFGGLTVLGICSFVYWLKIWRQRFVVVTEVRVWGPLAQKFPPAGVTARLRDELMLVCNVAMEADSDKKASVDGNEWNEKRQVQLIEGGLSLPETHITLQYEGISFEGFLTFVRRITNREVVLSGDVAEQDGSLLFFARGTHDGPWKITISGDDTSTLDRGLRRLALHIMATLTERFEPKAASAFGLLHKKARELKDYDLGLHLAKLGFRAAPDSFPAKSNLATAYSDLGVKCYNEALKSQDTELTVEVEAAIEAGFIAAVAHFKEAAKLNPNFKGLQNYLDLALSEVEEIRKRREVKNQTEASLTVNDLDTTE